MYKKLNYATGVLSAGISSSSTEVVLKAGHTITTETGEANKFVGVFFDKIKSSPFQDINREIVEAYRTDTNKFTIARAKEGTSAKSWVEDDNFMLIASSAVFDEYEEELGYKENLANKKTTITDSDTDYLTSSAVKTAVEAREPLLTKGNLSGSGVITIDNTRQVIGGAATISHTDSATVRHVTDTEKATWNAKQNALGYTPENVANKKTSITDSDTDYLTSKAVKTAVDAKAPIASPTFTGTVGLPKAVNVKDTNADHEYQLGVSELAANRTVTLPLLTGNDEFVFKAHTQTLTNKTLGTGSVINEATMTLGSDADGDVYYRASNKLTRLGKGTAGQVLTMNSGATAPQWSNPTAGGISWSIVTDDTTMNVDTGSLANKGTLLTLTLPSTSAVGKTIRVAGMNAGLWKIAQASNQYIKFGNLSTTIGTEGSLLSTQAYDAVELVCIEANKGWVVVSSIGNITVV